MDCCHSRRAGLFGIAQGVQKASSPFKNVEGFAKPKLNNGNVHKPDLESVVGGACKRIWTKDDFYR